jgi:hypothetical protein
MIRMYAQKGRANGPSWVDPSRSPVAFPLLSSGIASTTGNINARMKGAAAAIPATGKILEAGRRVIFVVLALCPKVLTLKRPAFASVARCSAKRVAHTWRLPAGLTNQSVGIGERKLVAVIYDQRAGLVRTVMGGAPTS